MRLGTRGSALALWQARHVKALLEKARPGLGVKLDIIKTEGDAVKTPLAEIGGKGLFVRKIEMALKKGLIDLAVHSLKDMPALLPEDLVLTAYLKRAEARDALCAKRRGMTISGLPRGARVGTGSARRGAELRRVRPDLTVVPLRGNVPTRLRKLKNQKLDAIILAGAGLIRLGLERNISELISTTQMIPSPCQGVIAIETRKDDRKTRSLLIVLGDERTAICVRAERAFLKAVGGDCKTPMGALATLRGDTLWMKAFLASEDGLCMARGKTSGPASRSAALGVALARKLMKEVASRHQ